MSRLLQRKPTKLGNTKLLDRIEQIIASGKVDPTPYACAECQDSGWVSMGKGKGYARCTNAVHQSTVASTETALREREQF